MDLTGKDDLIKISRRTEKLLMVTLLTILDIESCVWYCEVLCKRIFPIQLGWKKEKVSKNPQSGGNTELPTEQLV